MSTITILAAIAGLIFIILIILFKIRFRDWDTFMWWWEDQRNCDHDFIDRDHPTKVDCKKCGHIANKKRF